MIVRFFSPLATSIHSMFVERGTAYGTGPGVARSGYPQSCGTVVAGRNRGQVPCARPEDV